MREKGTDKNAIDGKLSAAAHKGGEYDGHFAFPFTSQCSRCHDGGNATTKAYDERNKGRAGKADFTQELIHNKGHTGHVTAVL